MGGSSGKRRVTEGDENVYHSDKAGPSTQEDVKKGVGVKEGNKGRNGAGGERGLLLQVPYNPQVRTLWPWGRPIGKELP